MFFRFRKAGRSELLKEEAHDATSVPEKERERADSVDASTTVVGSAAVNGLSGKGSAEACPTMSEPQDTGRGLPLSPPHGPTQGAKGRPTVRRCDC